MAAAHHYSTKCHGDWTFEIRWASVDVTHMNIHV